ncbi:DUF1559 family PulG-like putative transporter [Anatilimnocola floriformis]|uniref:DUF1559 family PulG-like putative transporter n=1 Tax=Anatilimnocola floriformis TaxID=2948575 RepID=UPI0020C350D1|nr:DUF1559 domain-containing protein [Anatilimnocola floriformis]
MPINFSCPHCGKQTVVADQFAGQTGPCSACGKSVTIPLTASSYPAGPSTKSSSGTAALLVILATVAVLGVICLGGAGLLFFPVISQSRISAQQTKSLNNLKQIALALHNYHDTYNSLPPAVVTDTDGQPLYSGRVLLLPFLDQNAVYQAFDKNKAWDSPENQAITATIIKTFQDPAHPGGPAAPRSDYVFVTGTGTIFEGSKTTNFASITDGTSNTIMVIQTATGPQNWAEPVDWNADSGVLPPGNHPQVVLTAFADGSVRAIRTHLMQMALQQLMQRADDRSMPDLGY